MQTCGPRGEEFRSQNINSSLSCTPRRPERLRGLRDPDEGRHRLHSQAAVVGGLGGARPRPPPARRPTPHLYSRAEAQAPPPAGRTPRPRLPVREGQGPGCCGAVQTVLDLGLRVPSAGFRGKEARGWALIHQQRRLDCNWRQEKERIAQPPVSRGRLGLTRS